LSLFGNLNNVVYMYMFSHRKRKQCNLSFNGVFVLCA